jgi:hypothetical protein
MYRSPDYPHTGGGAETIETEYADVTEDSPPDGEPDRKRGPGPAGGSGRNDTPWRQ